MFMPEEFYDRIEERQKIIKGLVPESTKTPHKPLLKRSEHVKTQQPPVVSNNKPAQDSKTIINGINIKDAMDLLNHPIIEDRVPKLEISNTTSSNTIVPQFLRLTEEELQLSNQVFNLSIEKIRAVIPKVKQAVVESLRQLSICVVKYDMDMYTYDFLLSQTYHESYLIYNRVESFRYKKSRMLAVFGRHHPDVKRNPTKYIGNPQALANYVYANRMGNGPESSGDGWRYRGRGLTQITGKDMYRLMTKLYNRRYNTNISFVRNPDLTLVPQISARIVFLFWYYKKIPNVISKAYAQGESDYNITKRVTKLINGGTNGLKERYKNLIALQVVNYDESSIA